YLQGAVHVLTKPVRARMLSALLQRLWPVPTTPGPVPATVVFPEISNRASEPVAPPGTAQTLGMLRGLSGILTHSLNAEGMIKQFLLLLREILSINRAAVFLRQPVGPGGISAADSRRLRAACALGLSSGLLEHFELSFEGGIGGHLFRLGRIL